MTGMVVLRGSPNAWTASMQWVCGRKCPRAPCAARRGACAQEAHTTDAGCAGAAKPGEDGVAAEA
jgi:hypothetical protein